MRKNILFTVFTVLLYSSCISDYTPSDIEELSGMLVIEGIIVEGENTITVSRTVGLLDKLDGTEYITDARVYIEGDNGFRSDPGVYQQNGKYLIDGIDFESGVGYRVYVDIDNREYVSEYLVPLSTPEISSIDALKKEQGEPVRICVNVEDPSEDSYYYLWTYEETWEVWANIFASVGYEEIDGVEQLVKYDITTSNNKYYCWGRDRQTSFLLESAEKYTGNKIVNRALIELEPSDDKLSVLYHVKVRQHLLRKAAFDFYYNLQKNVDSGGSIFGSMPMEVKGNITSLTDPEELVIGYIEVTSFTEQERYFPVTDGLYERSNRLCRTYYESELDDYQKSVLVLIYLKQYSWEDDEYSTNYCVDCRTRKYASKNKPDFWPTDKL